MMLFKMAFRNIKKRFRDYSAFFLSSAFSIFVLYLFLSVSYNNKVISQIDDSETIKIIFITSAVLIALFVAFFICYSNSYFIKSHKKEFATYMILGVSKRQTAVLNLIENTIVLLLAFCTGIAFGVLLDKFFIMILFSVIKSNEYVPFEFSIKAFKITAYIFAAIYILISINGFRLINKSTLIELINASKKAEKKLKVSVFTWIISIAAIICMGSGYYLSVKKLSNMNNLWLIPGVILLVSVGTLLLFTGVISILIYIKRKNERKLYKGTKLITESQISYRYMSNVGTLSVIAISTTVAFCAVITMCGLFGRVAENSHNIRPFSVEYVESRNADNTFQSVLSSHSEVGLKSKDMLNFIRVKINNSQPEMGEQDVVVSESNFNKAVASQGKNVKVDIKNDNDCYFITSISAKGYEGKTIQVSDGKKSVPLKIVKNKAMFYVTLNHEPSNTYVVKDSVFDKLKGEAGDSSKYTLMCCQLKNDLTAKSFTNDLNKKMPEDANTLTFYEHYDHGMKLSWVLMFIGVFIGLVFLSATGSIIYFRMFMESREDKDKYMILKRIGVSSKEIKYAISKELLAVFGAPFVVAVSNACAALLPLEKLLTFKVGNTFIIMIIVYAIFYFVYYLVTLHSYYKTVSE